MFILKYDIGMKVAISLPDDLFESADALAQAPGDRPDTVACVKNACDVW